MTSISEEGSSDRSPIDGEAIRSLLHLTPMKDGKVGFEFVNTRSGSIDPILGHRCGVCRRGRVRRRRSIYSEETEIELSVRILRIGK